jgi:hypothetical protein
MKREGIILAFGRRWDRRLSEKCDFKDVPKRVKGRSCGLYVLYNKKRIIYIGKSLASLKSRIRQHTGDHLKNKWDSYAWFITRRRYTSILEALLLNIFWKVKDVTVNIQKPKIKASRHNQKSMIKQLKVK